MAQAETPKPRAEGNQIDQEKLAAVRRWCRVVQVSAPFGDYETAAEVIASALRREEREGKKQCPSFEESLKKLETIVEQLEKRRSGARRLH